MVSRRKKLEEYRERLSAAGRAEIDNEKLFKATLAFQKKATRRLKTFLLESERMDKKLPEFLAKVKSLGYNIKSMDCNALVFEEIYNYRKKTGGIGLSVTAERDGHAMHGTLSVSPASIRLELHAPDLKSVKTKSGFPLPTLKITYYRTLNVRDNYLAALVGGRPAVPDESEENEVPF